eukprot:scaffold4239_cov111-Skeletonema_marinoi.AAC.2
MMRTDDVRGGQLLLRKHLAHITDDVTLRHSALATSILQSNSAACMFGVVLYFSDTLYCVLWPIVAIDQRRERVCSRQ